MIQIHVQRLVRCSRHDRPLLTMGAGEHPDWQLALWLPDNEAERLARALGLAGHGCVAIFDLVEALIEKLGCRVTAAVLDTAEGAVVAALHVGDGTRESAIACHPADAIALATRAGAPIHATAETVRRGRRPAVQGRDADVAAWLSSVRPEDFQPRG